MLFSLLLFTFANTPHYSRSLFIGDSHSYGNFGKQIDSYLREISDEVVSISSCGSSPSTWERTDGKFQTTNCGYWKKDAKGHETRINSQKINSFDSEVNAIKPDLTIVALGTNILSSEQNIKRELAHVESMLQDMKRTKSQCVWIGPPDVRKEPFKTNLRIGINLMKQLVEAHSCIFIDSTKFTAYPEKGYDGIHYSPNDSLQWGNAARSELQQRLKSTDKEPISPVRVIKPSNL